MKKIVLIIGLILFLTINSYSEEWKTHTGSSSYFKYSIDYPSHWKAEDMWGFVFIGTPLEDSSDKYRENVLISVADLSKKSMSLKEWEDLWIKITNDQVSDKMLSNFKILDKGKTTINGKETLSSIYTINEGEGLLKCRRYTFMSDTSAYELTYKAKEKNFDKYLSQAEKIIQSIKVFK